MDEQLSTKDPVKRLALEPLYTLEVACELIPMPTKQCLEQFLFHNKALFSPLYRMSRWHRIRMLSESDCLKIREMTTFRGKRNGTGYNPMLDKVKESGAPFPSHSRPSHKSGLEKGPKTARQSSPLARILRMANA